MARIWNILLKQQTIKLSLSANRHYVPVGIVSILTCCKTNLEFTQGGVYGKCAL